MKKLLLLLSLFLCIQEVKAQMNCNYFATQVGSTVTFNYPPMISIIVLDSAYWDFGDGTTLMQYAGGFTIVTHTYTAPGTYNACLTMWGHQLGSTTVLTCTGCQTFTVTGPPPCNASFNFVQAGNTVSFTSTSSGPGVITSNVWVYGDASPNGTTANPVHTYPGPGQYIVCHTISGGTSAGVFTCTTCDTITIASPPPPCIATANYSTTISGLTVNFNNTSSCTNCMSQINSWDFGDGTLPSLLPSPSHTFATGGTYNVCLTLAALDSNGTPCTDTLCKLITVVGPSGVTEHHLHTLDFYPNPAGNSIAFNLPVNEQIQSIEVFDLTGRMISEVPSILTSTQEVSLNIQSLETGLYMVKVQMQSMRSFSGKFLKH
ncbi:MAG: PKD domain-containing protein [Bacteroidetes bacterium]|nr:PKD domain-containing protein [Bacteroidota bacterium]